MNVSKKYVVKFLKNNNADSNAPHRAVAKSLLSRDLRDGASGAGAEATTVDSPRHRPVRPSRDAVAPGDLRKVLPQDVQLHPAKLRRKRPAAVGDAVLRRPERGGAEQDV